MISIIAAMDEKRGIGKDNKIPWHISEDFKRVKALTTGHPIIMGRKTYESIGKVLPDRTTIIISRDPELDVPEAFIVSSLDMALEAASDVVGSEEVFIFGGGQVFKEALEQGMVDRLYLTVIEGDFKCDTFFPDYVSAGYEIVKEEGGESGEYKYKFLTLEN